MLTERSSREARGVTPWAPRLSAEQLRFYFLHQLNPRDPDIHICRVLRVAGPLDVERLRRATLELARRHDVLRSVYPMDADAPAIWLCEDVSAAFSAPPLSPIEDLAAAIAEAVVARELTIAEPFDLERGPLFHLTALSIAPDRHLLVARFHHLLVDGASVRLLLGELLSIYAASSGTPAATGAANAEPARRPASQYRDFLEWEAHKDRPEARAHALAFWRAQLASPTPIDLAAALAHALPRPSGASGSSGSSLSSGSSRPVRASSPAATVHAALDPSLRHALAAFCRQHRVTPYLVLSSVTQLLLHQLTGEDDVLLGTPVALRSRREHLSMIGVLVGWLALRARIDPSQPFLARLAEARAELARAHDHPASYELLLSAAGELPRDPARAPLFQVTLNYAALEPLAAPPGLSITLDPVEPRATPYELALRFEDSGDACTLGLTYRADVLPFATAERLAASLLSLAAHCLAHPDRPLDELRLPGLDALLPRRPAAILKARPATSRPEHHAHQEHPPRSIVLAATFTAEPLGPALEHWLERLALPARVAFAPIDQLFQQLCDPHSLVARNTLGVNVLLLRLEDWDHPERAVPEFCAALTAHAERSPAPVVVVVCPPPAAHRAPAPLARHRALAAQLTAAAEPHPRLHALLWEDVFARYPVDELDDAEADAYARSPYSADASLALATALARQLHALLRPAPKVLVLDCDHTLWRGVVGEDGVDGLVIDDGRRALQRRAALAERAGVLLCLVSKNAEADVWQVFERRPDMLLRREQIVAHRINWRPKSQNLASLAAELNLGLDAFLFLDDSAAECAEVRAHCPAALTIQVPSDPAHLLRFVDHLWPLDPRKATGADRQRTAQYRANAQRQALRDASADLRAFLASLDVRVTFRLLSEETLARAAQLTQRTNQLNTTTIRRSEAELCALAEVGQHLLVVDVTDRFGDLGTVGFVSYAVGADALEVGALMLSCRALGRGVEQRILVELGSRAEEAGVARVDLAFSPTAKNEPARAMLEAHAGRHCERLDDTRFVYRLPVEEALAAAPISDPDPDPDPDPDRDPDPDPDRAALHYLWRAIPDELNTIPKIRRAFAEHQRARRRARVLSTPLLPPHDPLEHTLVDLWRDALAVDVIGIDDDYFAAGGDSLRSLSLCAAMRRAGFPVTVLDLHAHPTIAKLAAALRDRTTSASPAAASPSDVSSPSSTPPASPASLTSRASRPSVDALDLAPSSGPYPLSFSQRYVVATYARENLTAGASPTGVFHLQDRFTVVHRQLRPSMPALHRAVDQLVRRTQALRSRLVRDPDTIPSSTSASSDSLSPSSDSLSTVTQLELTTWPALLSVLDLSRLDSAAQRAELQRLLDDDRRRPFDPERASSAPIRFTAAITAADRFELLISAHHAFCDGWSLQTAYGRLFALYEAYLRDDELRAADLEHELRSIDGAFRQLVHREHNPAPSSRIATTAYWRDRALAIRAAAAPPRAGSTPSHHIKTMLLPIPWSLVVAVDERARACATSRKALFLDAFAAALPDEPGDRPASTSRLFAVVTNGRKDDLPASVDPTAIFGLCWTLTPIVVDLAPDAEPDADRHLRLAALHQQLLDAELHARHPVEEMFHALPEHVASISFTFTSFHNAAWRDATSHLHLTRHPGAHHFPFSLDASVRLDERAETAALGLSWDPARHDEPFARALLEAVATNLSSASAEPAAPTSR